MEKTTLQKISESLGWSYDSFDYPDLYRKEMMIDQDGHTQWILVPKSGTLTKTIEDMEKLYQSIFGCGTMCYYMSKAWEKRCDELNIVTHGKTSILSVASLIYASNGKDIVDAACRTSYWLSSALF